MRHSILWQIAFATLTFTLIFTFLSTDVSAEANGTLERYRNAEIVRQLAETLQSPTIPEELKTRLLDTARSEDREYAKSLVINWNQMTQIDVRVEFDELVSVDSDGNEILRMKRLEEPESFLINGRKWTMPSHGSISKSLRRHLEWHSDDFSDDSSAQTSPAKYNAMSKLWISLASAAPAKPSAPPIALAPAYLLSIGKMEVAQSTADTVRTRPPTGVVGQHPIFDGINSLVGVDVNCANGTATGYAKIWNDRFAFESRRDGSVVYNMNDDDKTKLLVTSKTIDMRKLADDRLGEITKFEKMNSRDPKRVAAGKKIFQDFMAKTLAINSDDRIHRKTYAALAKSADFISKDQDFPIAVAKNLKLLREFYNSRSKIIATEEMTASICAKPDCTVVDSGQRSTIQPWLSKDSQQHIVNALAWRTTASNSPSVRIVRTETAGIPEFSVSPKNAKLTTRDAGTANRLIEEARRAARRSDGIVRDTMLSLRPLGACCDDPPCRAILLKRKIKLTPVESAVKQ